MHSDVDIIKKYQSIMSSALTRKLEFDISFAEFKRIYNQKKCFYTNKKLQHGGNGNFSIDRVDNSKGYISGNIVACDTKFNSLKSNLSIEDINNLYFGITKFFHK